MSGYAIVGLSCLFPGASSPQQFWDNLLAGHDSRREAGAEVFGFDPADPAFADPEHRITTTRGGFIDRPEVDRSRAELAGYRIPAADLADLDDVFTWSLRVARQAVQDGGLQIGDPVLERTGVVFGNYTFPTRNSSEAVLPLLGEAVLDGLRRAGVPVPQAGTTVRPSTTDLGVGGLPALVIGSALGLGGPRLALDAACSSALYALKLACDSLATGAADLMIAGGVCAPDPALIHLSFSDLQAYPENGISQPFDSASGGILTGQGAGAVAVKRLADAVRDGDRIHAVIEGIGLSNDGSGRHVLVPNPEGQLATYALAYADAGVDPEDVDYIECHATGTPLGDATELAALERWYAGRGHRPRLGSVKGNVGHLLTVAGLTSLLKTVLAMQHGVIPPTPGVQEALSSPDGTTGGALIVRQAIPWPDRGVRRAGVSAFGFGGTNAHAILRAPDAVLDAQPAVPEPNLTGPPPATSITGLGIHVGGLADAASVESALRSGAADERPVPAQRWYGVRDPEAAGTPDGSYLDAFDVDAPRFQIPPKELGHFNEQHLLMLRVAEQALLDDGLHQPEAGLRRPDRPRRRVAVLIAAEMEPRTHAHRARLGIGQVVGTELDAAGLVSAEQQREQVLTAARQSLHDPVAPNEVLSYIGNVMASRISGRWNLTGPAFTLAADSGSAATALEVAALLLRDESIEAVLVGAVDLAGGAETVLSRFGADATAPAPGSVRRPGDGAAAIVLRRTADLPAEARRYASIEAVAVRHGVAGEAGAVQAAARAALAQAGVAASEVGLLQVHDALVGADSHEAGQLPWLNEAYPADGTPTCAVARVAETLGDPGIAGGLAAVVAAALSLRHGYLPGTRQDCGSTPAGSAFYLPAGARSWLRRSVPGRRIAAVALRGNYGSAAHLILAADPGVEPRATVGTEPGTSSSASAVRWTAAGAPFLLPVPAIPAELPERLLALRERLSAGEDLASLCREGLVDAAAPDAGSPRVRAVLVGADRAALLAELERLLSDLPGLLVHPGAEPTGPEWATPGGSYLTLEPVGPAGRVALVYPGAFNSYLGMAQDLLELFPGLTGRLEARSPNPDHTMRAQLLWPRSRTPMARRDKVRLEEQLIGDIPAMLATSTSHALLITDLLREVLGVPAAGAFGYSLGESSMLRSLGVWGPDPVTDRRIDTTQTFVDRLCGPRRTVRRLWNLGDDVPDREVWASQVLMASAAGVQELLPEYDRLFLTHVNTAGEVVVAGAPNQLRALVDRLGSPAARTPGEHVMHCPMVDPDLEELAALNTYPAHDPGAGVELFTSGGYRRVTEFGSAELADNIAETLRSCVDFPRLIETAYAAGYRYFIEVGPGATCTRWIDETLRGRAHVAVSADRRGRPAATSVSHLLARLIGNGVPLPLDALFPAPAPAGLGRSLALQVRCGGPSIRDRMQAAIQALDLDPTPTVSTETSHAMTETPNQPVQFTQPSQPTYQPLPAISLEPSPEVARERPSSAPEPLPTIGLEPLPALSLEPLPTLSPQPPVPRSAEPVPVSSVPSAVSAPVATASAALAFDPAAEVVSISGEASGAASGPALSFHGVPLSTVLNRVRVDADLIDAPFSDWSTGISTGDTGPRQRPPGVIWDQQDLLTFATGRIADVFGPDFADIDEFAKRVRLPEPPYLLSSRVIKLDATPGELEPATLSSEYDITADAWYCIDGQVPAAITIEAGQCDMILVSYLGIDRHNRGERFYRLLDSTLTFHDDLPQAGQTLRYDISIDKFVSHGEVRLFFFSYRCYADDKLILELNDACAGFFTQEELEASGGIVVPKLARRGKNVEKRFFKPLLRTDRISLEPADLADLGAGRIAKVFGPAYDQGGLNPSLRLPDERLRMIDEIASIDRRGGDLGLGHLSAIKYLDPAGWYFRCHFTDDPVLAGSLVAEGGVQILQAYALSLGLQTVLPDARFQTVPGLQTQVKVRGQITPKSPSIRYEVDITDLTLLPRPTMIADITVYDGDRAVISMRNFGVQLREKPGTAYRADAGGITRDLGRRNLAGEVAVINELHLAHAAKGDLGTAMGPEFDVYHDHRAPHIPNGDFQFVDRIMRLEGVRGQLKSGAVMETEYDSPPEAWYYADNNTPAMPNCVLLETSLQAAILLGYYLGATLDEPQTEYSIRNLDGTATVLRHVDLRGKTIRQRTRLLSSSAVTGTVLQNFAYELSVDGEPFYRGTSLFGYFTAEALSVQAGLDNGKYVAPWIDQQPQLPAGTRRIDLATDPSYLIDELGGGMRLPDGQLRLLDWADVVPGGGRSGAGYVRAQRRVTPQDWYFSCHFHRDPVMPGSLGVESVLEGLQLFALTQDLHAGMTAPTFQLARDVPVRWRYRGQISTTDPELHYEIHVKEVRRESGRVLVIADASLYKPGLRIYQLDDLALEIVDSAPVT
ncbi:MAG TPA: beta-ketoacyl synthase N-terminal-like domain-containing protein [Kineosporiaceae bacterium]|nr:beta-ketoacyl synthase N-terminal-like domain-containing protein [Kineosporiaceae bacterium]